MQTLGNVQRALARLAAHKGAPTVGAVTVDQTAHIELDHVAILHPAPTLPRQGTHRDVFPLPAHAPTAGLHRLGHTGLPSLGNLGAIHAVVNGRNGFHHASFGPSRRGLQALDFARRLDHLDRTDTGTGVAPHHDWQHLAQQAVIGHGPKVQIQTQAGLGQARTFQQVGQLAKGCAGIKHRWSRKTSRPLRLGAVDQLRS